MDKDGTATHRRHRPGPGAPPMGVGPAHLKAASEMAELQRSRSVGGLLQKGDPPSCIKLCKELESEDPGKDVRSEAEDASCQASLEDKQDGGQDARGQAPEDAKVEEASTCREQPAGGEGADECAPEDEELEPESIKLDDLLEKEARESRFSGGIRRGGRGARFCCGCRNHLCLWRLTWETVPRSALRTLPGAQGAPVSGTIFTTTITPVSTIINHHPTHCLHKRQHRHQHHGHRHHLRHHRFSTTLCKRKWLTQWPDWAFPTQIVSVSLVVVTCIMKEEKRSQRDMGDVSEDESRTSWVCCIPYSTRKKVKQSA
ncbi:uncharacterized protein C13orf46 homolog isoform X1 [Bubalus bubalis]|uniref:uncharacterized protein C13orf46 homolog isoform X1 n=1 Tax=Bubalus bubalis TaxID=89462 RepID=UPI001E1B78C2|nr:uncharacterized protein C13orf46 homolog isoform X1 [Bubalus bubalis]XP_044782952.2 uncharacterized protein C13orf46 homolog isoform X1 [Bubalus bubalis]